MKEDKYIWEEFKNGEEYALSYIYHQNIDFLFFFGKKITKDEELILDIIQDLFYELIRSKQNLGETDNIRLYLLKSFRRKLIKVLQQKQKQEERKYEIQPNIIFSAEEDWISTEENSRKRELIIQGIKELNLKQREVLYYKFTCGFDYKQISEIMAVTNESARQLSSRAIQTLKKYLLENGLILLTIIRRIIKN